MADVGQTYNSSVTYQHLVADNPDVSALFFFFPVPLSQTAMQLDSKPVSLQQAGIVGRGVAVPTSII